MATQDMHSQVKRFVAPNMTRALELVREEMGPEAVILSSKKIDKGVEIITALEPDLPTRGIDVRREFGRNFDADLDRAMKSDSAWRSSAGIEQAAASFSSRTEMNSEAGFKTRTPSADLAREIERAREKMLEAKRSVQQSAQQPAQQQSEMESKPTYQETLVQKMAAPKIPNTEEPVSRSKYEFESPKQDSAVQSLISNEIAHNEEKQRLDELQSDLADMRMLLEQQLWKMSEGPLNQASVSMQQQIKMPQHFSMVREHLDRVGLSESICTSITADLGQFKRASEAWRDCMAHLSKLIPTTKTELVKHGGVFAFVGQTGVGKTTTIAKLAAQYVLDHGPGKVALVTTDTYRVGAYDQLRSIGRILNVPVKAVDSDNSLLTLIAQLRKYPLVLIDTAGFRHGDPMLKAQLNQIDTCHLVKKVLVLASTSQLPTMKASVHAFSRQKPIEASVITKLDETASMGEVISVVCENHLPVAYTTDGQEIPKDIAVAAGHSIVAKAVSLLKSQQSGIGQTAHV